MHDSFAHDSFAHDSFAHEKRATGASRASPVAHALCVAFASVLAGGVATARTNASLAQETYEPSGLSYSWVDLGLTRTDFDHGDDDWGGALRGSFVFDDNLYVYGGFGRDTIAVAGPESRRNSFELGVGFRRQVFERTDLIGGVSWLRSSDEDGYGLFGGVRHGFNDVLDLELRVLRQDLDDGEAGFDVAARYELQQSVSVGVRGLFFDDADALALELRWSR